jgi:hypothetical protein
MFKVTKRFTSGLLAGLVIEEVTSVEFKVGFEVKAGRHGSGYVVAKVEATVKEAA